MIVSLIVAWLTIPVYANTDSKVEAIRNKLESLNQMREGLASSLVGVAPSQINEETFKKTCMPVGIEFKRWGQENKFVVRQIAEKNRNPVAAPTTDEKVIFEKFKSDKTLKVLRVDGKTQPGTTVYYRIPMTKACFACHGDKESRPDFILKKYPSDLAFGFKEGDLRGLYSVSF